MKSRKVPGAYCVITEVMEAAGDKMAEEFLKLCNNSVASERLTIDWCRSIINPIHKKKMQVNNLKYRATSLIAKVLCKMILKRIDDTIEAHLSKQQFRFRKKQEQ